MKVKDMTITAVMAALICIAGPLVVPVGPVPLSLATFAVYLAGAVLGKKRGTIAAGLYLVIGIIGVPVFSGFSGGFQKLAGVTGGYLVGYLPCAFLAGLGAERAESAAGSGSRARMPAFGREKLLFAALGAAAALGACLLAPEEASFERLSLRVVPALNAGVCLLLLPGVYALGRARKRI